MASPRQHETRSFALKRADGERVLVQIVPATKEHLELHDTVWKPQLRAAHALDADWSWLPDFLDIELPSDTRETYALIVEGAAMPEALMSLELQEDTVYVERLAVAPWNRKLETRLKGCGPALMQMAIARSVSRGFRGRLWLHSLEDPDTLKFYRRSMMMLEGEAELIDGSKMRRFEMTEAVAKQFLGGAA